ncbi:MAG: patatin-like phospholipase family protein [Sandaracinus sp.]|nr:patatin-like phospholipase family protein [Myxococcales bacterium]MCB9613608.1 patatin-like phospholipase family protein [Sandaracinus sp.]MCB9617474.1 patatin-like phospholipase family protein [Sandaracinus sp.]MCB9618136.1 patatin-like phospholipase family protein [Sandaracinus sp.]MCB9624137.1 patatin-like phospholipase family protein [Sandaracinus sp.]
MSEQRDLGLTFAGGGSRAFYQLGLLERWGDQMLPRVAGVAGCSAGAAMAVLLYSGRIDRARKFFAERRQGVRGHMQWSRVLEGKRPFPHHDIYRATLIDALSEGGLENLRNQPFPIRFLCAAFPKAMPSVVGVALGLGFYTLEKAVRPKMVHPTFPQKLGFTPRAYDARDCESPEELTELVLASSSTPPFTRRGRFGQELLLDGSMVDNAPAYLLEDIPEVKRHVVLMTRPYKSELVGEQGDRFYVAPTRPLPISRWDYRQDAPVDETFQIGLDEATHHGPALERFLSR